MKRRYWIGGGLALLAAVALALALFTRAALMPLPAALPPPSSTPALLFTARDGTPLNRTHRSRFNYTQRLPLWRMPVLLKEAFVASEDRRFWQHGGADWRARFAALGDDLRARRIVRGASTIGEQAARILEPRPRNYWSHWIAGFDADRLIERFGRADVLQFYLNQVPYGGRRRGVLPAAHYYFGRDLAALSPAELLALAILVRSPESYDPRRHSQHLRAAVDELAARMRRESAIGAMQYAAIVRSPIVPGHEALALNAGPFVRYAAKRAQALGLPGIRQRTTLDPALERFVQAALRNRLAQLADRGAKNAAALVVDNATGEILAWAVAPGGNAFGIDPVLAPRQPGSALKPFVYALAMEQLGWQADTLIDDAPLAEKVGSGVHRYRNYSDRYYGEVSLRYALANSLNIPAVETAQAVGTANILALFERLGFRGFEHTADYYGPAIALGDGAVRLFDLVQAYAALARRGRFLPLRVLAAAPAPPSSSVVSPAVTSLIADILSDPSARAAEFGANSVLDLPWPTAVKTGTSSDYRDAWAVGFDNRYTIGVWMGRLAGGRMQQVTGSLGPALVLRQIFDRLRPEGAYAGLWRSPKLQAITACEPIGPERCTMRPEWRLPGEMTATQPHAAIAIAEPLPGETLALDPRLPAAAQRYRFRISGGDGDIAAVVWRLDGKTLTTTRAPSASWQLVAGVHRLSAEVRLTTGIAGLRLGQVQFRVLGGEAATKDSRSTATGSVSPPGDGG
ncbi:MAG TPA: transglycosylase domain-containing protein [Gammaproteobacteria bacterium]|nr:transglycosylase domain-containing protein [Gammaproteobacteria bacterium]